MRLPKSLSRHGPEDRAASRRIDAALLFGSFLLIGVHGWSLPSGSRDAGG
jgi:hypothetical protein